MARPTKNPIFNNQDYDPRKDILPPPPTVRLIGGGLISLGGGVCTSLGTCAQSVRVVCTVVAGITTCVETVAGTAIGILTAEVSAGVGVCILVAFTIGTTVYHVCKSWADQYGEELEAAKLRAQAEEAFCNTQWGPTSELAVIANAMFNAGTISYEFYQQTMDKLAALLKSCVDSAWSLVLKMVNDAVNWTNEQMGGYGRGAE